MRTILLAGGLSLLLTLLLTPQFIKFLTRRQYGQFIRDDGPKEHLTKRGTPTMGGVVIVASVTFAYFAAHVYPHGFFAFFVPQERTVLAEGGNGEHGKVERHGWLSL